MNQTKLHNIVQVLIKQDVDEHENNCVDFLFTDNHGIEYSVTAYTKGIIKVHTDLVEDL